MNNHPFNYEACCKRLLSEYYKYGKLIVAFDFDNTIFDYHENGGDYSCVIDLLCKCSELRFTMVLFTAHDSRYKLNWITNYCQGCGISVDFINSSPIMNTRKPYYNILLDDRAGLEESYNILKYVVDEAKADL